MALVVVSKGNGFLCGGPRNNGTAASDSAPAVKPKLIAFAVHRMGWIRGRGKGAIVHSRTMCLHRSSLGSTTSSPSTRAKPKTCATIVVTPTTPPFTVVYGNMKSVLAMKPAVNCLALSSADRARDPSRIKNLAIARSRRLRAATFAVQTSSSFADCSFNKSVLLSNLSEAFV